MNDRNDYDGGSTRSTRDDLRTNKNRNSSGSHYRSRSRSPQQRHDASKRENEEKYMKKYSKEMKDGYSKKDSESSGKWKSDEEVPAPPPPPRISKISIAFSKPGPKVAPIKMSLNSPAAKAVTSTSKPKLAAVFNADDDDEPEEMPAEARMRMRNIGRETPTSAGPNSFGKTKQGFCDSKKVFEKNLKQALETADKSAAPAPSKLPQTIYKISGP
ncbi:PEST proteolytic signal-containing nuclear protein [Eumeta japonica]|uniref:PEST proteolytic signal-containing nuclear protein n=1 Tax=Eumeta variegata TaxID=151549 RepID=A0A4C1TVI4_EUMVA|nr:PEST proteolytic signal-containing nuclear protein [Eumeta japonica]